MAIGRVGTSIPAPLDDTRRPPVLPVMVHDGASPWRAPVEVAGLDRVAGGAGAGAS